MFYRIFTLHPEIFESFVNNSLIARGVTKNILSFEFCNWREKFGVGNYKQVDDRPYGGGTGMVLKPQPIFNALDCNDAISTLFKSPEAAKEHIRTVPNNSSFFKHKLANLDIKKATIMLSPRGFTLNQDIVTWLANFEELNIICGRYEGFDARVSEVVDLEISLGNYVLNGGEVGAMSLIESVSRMIPGFVTRNESIVHDSFSSELNFYKEMEQFVIGKNKNSSNISNLVKFNDQNNLFDDENWKNNILPKIEHPHYTRPNSWQNLLVPGVIMSGDHKKIQYWRKNWHKI